MTELRSPVASLTRRNPGGAVHTVRQEANWVVLFLGVIWGSFLLDAVTPIDRLGLVPRALSGSIGIVTMTFIHHSWSHLLSNTVPLFILLILLAGSRARSWRIVLTITLMGGTLLWFFGRPGMHVGASLLVFGLISFLIASGLYFERRPIPVVVALIVGFLYGVTLLSGVMPRISSSDRVSWDGHLCGAIAGVIVAFALTRLPLSKREAT